MFAANNKVENQFLHDSRQTNNADNNDQKDSLESIKIDIYSPTAMTEVISPTLSDDPELKSLSPIEDCDSPVSSKFKIISEAYNPYQHYKSISSFTPSQTITKEEPISTKQKIVTGVLSAISCLGVSTSSAIGVYGLLTTPPQSGGIGISPQIPPILSSSVTFIVSGILTASMAYKTYKNAKNTILSIINEIENKDYIQKNETDKNNKLKLYLLTQLVYLYQTREFIINKTHGNPNAIADINIIFQNILNHAKEKNIILNHKTIENFYQDIAETYAAIPKIPEQTLTLSEIRKFIRSNTAGSLTSFFSPGITDQQKAKKSALNKCLSITGYFANGFLSNTANTIGISTAVSGVCYAASMASIISPTIGWSILGTSLGTSFLAQLGISYLESKNNKREEKLNSKKSAIEQTLISNNNLHSTINQFTRDINNLYVTTVEEKENNVILQLHSTEQKHLTLTKKLKEKNKQLKEAKKGIARLNIVIDQIEESKYHSTMPNNSDSFRNNVQTNSELFEILPKNNSEPLEITPKSNSILPEVSAKNNSNLSGISPRNNAEFSTINAHHRSESSTISWITNWFSFRFSSKSTETSTQPDPKKRYNCICN